MSVGTPEAGVDGQLPVRWRRNADGLTSGQLTTLRQAHTAMMGVTAEVVLARGSLQSTPMTLAVSGR